MAIKLNFKNNSDLNLLNKPELNNINDILLSKNNPRFSTLENININLCEFIISETNNTNEAQNLIYEKLLKNEGDLSDLYRLLKNIETFGFQNYSENILLIWSDKIQKYVVAEGNRRIMSLKIIFGLLNLPKLDFFTNNAIDNNTTDYIDDYDDVQDCYAKNNKKVFENYKKINEIILNLKNEINSDHEIKWDVNFKIINSDRDEELWELIYDKHITGQRPGMREWSRAKYFADLLCLFPDGITENVDLKIFKKINREKDIVIKDFKEAQFVYSCFYFNLYDDELNFNDKEIIDDIVNSYRISALEKSHSYNKIKKIIINRYLNGDKDEFKEKYFDISYQKINMRIVFNEKIIKTQKLLKFIYNFWKKGIITTREIRDENMEDFCRELDIIVNNLKTNNILTKEELWELNEFDLSNSTLDNIILSNKDKYKNDPEVIKRFENVREIRRKNNQICESIKKIWEWEKNKENPVYVFKILIDQLEHNATKNFYNAVFCTVRSFFELLILFTSHAIFKDEQLFRNQIEVVEYLCDGRVSNGRKKVYSTFFKNKNNNNYVAYRIKFLQKIFNNTYYINNSEYLKEKFDKLLWNEDNWNLLNEFVHSSHKLCIAEEYTKKYKNFQEYQDLLKEIFDHCDWEIFRDVSSEVKKKLESSNQRLK